MVEINAVIPAGEDHVDVVHSLGYDDYVVIPIQLALGDTLTVSNQTTTGFTLTVDNIDAVNPRTFRCIIIEAAYATSSYGNLVFVRYLCGIDDALKDTELNAFLSKASTFIDDALENYVTTLPVSPAPEILNSIAEYWAAGSYLQKDQLDEKDHRYLAFAQSKLQSYIDNIIKADVAEADLPIAIGVDDS